MSAAFPALRRAVAVTLLAAVALGVATSLATAQTEPPAGSPAVSDGADASTPSGEPAGTRVVEVLPVRGGFLDPPVSAQIADVLETAAARGSELVVLEFSSSGGVSVDLEEVIDGIASSPVPVVSLVGPVGTRAEARGAAGMVWLGSHVQAISADATVGPLLPADLTALGDGRTEALARELVGNAGGDEAIADALLRRPVAADELASSGVAARISQGLAPLLTELDGVTVATAAGERELRIRHDEIEVRFHSLGLVRRLLHAATTAPFIYLLLVVGLGMLLFEVFQPGFGVAGLAGLVTLAVGVFGITVLPVAWWALALVVLGLMLYAVDTAIAGFGTVTLAATVAFVAGSLNFYAAEPLALNGWLVGATTTVVAGFFVFVMTSLLRAQAGPEGVRVDDLVGRPGIVRSVLNPEGHVYIDGALWRARWTGGSRRAKVGTPIRVHGVDGAVVLVDAFDADGPADGDEPSEPLARASDR